VQSGLRLSGYGEAKPQVYQWKNKRSFNEFGANSRGFCRNVIYFALALLIRRRCWQQKHKPLLTIWRSYDWCGKKLMHHFADTGHFVATNDNQEVTYKLKRRWRSTVVVVQHSYITHCWIMRKFSLFINSAGNSPE
jgi:hypothetical protein